MRRARPGLLALAIGLAMLPSPAAAAGPNQLVDPHVSPGSGSTTTAFAFSVRYVSDRSWPALSLSASVAGKMVILKRTAGTAADGTWSASANLPAGTWPVAFSADAQQGPNPSLAGPTVIVAVAATPTPQPAATPTPQPAAPAPAPTEATPTTIPSTGSTPATAAARPVAPAVSPSATPNPTMASPSASAPSASAPSDPAASRGAGPDGRGRRHNHPWPAG